MAWYNPIDWFTGIDAEIERGRELDAKIAEFNQQKVAEGSWTEQDYENYQRRQTYAETYADEVDRAFWDGAGEGWEKITSPISNAVDTGKKLLTFGLVLQYALAGLALYLAYRYAKGKKLL